MDENTLINILHGDIELIDTVNARQPELDDVNVTVYPKDVTVMLKRFLSGNLSANNLTKWAGFLSLRPEFASPNWEDDEMADFYEDMWNVINCVSTPEIDGEITVARVKGYLAELDKYNVQ